MDGIDHRYLAGFVLVDFLAILSRITELLKCVPVIHGFQDAPLFFPVFPVLLIGDVVVVLQPWFCGEAE